MILIIPFLQSCASKVVKQPVRVKLSAIHDSYPELHKKNMRRAMLSENDGNMYLTYWEKNEKNNSAFKTVDNKCSKKIYSEGYILKKIMSEISEDEIKPTLYKKFVQCISDEGFTYVSGDGYLPFKFRLTLFRGHSIQGQYMPVGARYYISKKGTSFLNVFRHVKKCERKILATKGGGVKDEYFSGFISVSIKQYVKSMHSCLTEQNYKLERY